MEWVTILDENDEPCQAQLRQVGSRVIAVKECGLLVFPGAYVVLSESGLNLLGRAIERS